EDAASNLFAASFFLRGRLFFSSGSVKGSGALFHLFRRNVLNVSPDMPHVPKRINEAAGSITIELVFNWSKLFGASFESLFEDRIDVFNIKHDAGGRATERLGTDTFILGMLVREHNRRIANFDLSVADFSVRPINSE